MTDTVMSTEGPQGTRFLAIGEPKAKTELGTAGTPEGWAETGPLRSGSDPRRHDCI